MKKIISIFLVLYSQITFSNELITFQQLPNTTISQKINSLSSEIIIGMKLKETDTEANFIKESLRKILKTGKSWQEVEYELSNEKIFLYYGVYSKVLNLKELKVY